MISSSASGLVPGRRLGFVGWRGTVQLLYDVVTCGFASAPMPWLDRPGHEGLPDPAAPDFLDVAFTALDGLEPDRRVLLVHAAGRAASQRLGVLRSALRNPFVLPVPLGLPVTGLAATAAWLAALAERDVTAGMAMAGLDEVARHLPTYAVTSSVAGLEMPEVKLRHHVLSWLPGTVFSISMTGTTLVEVGSASASRAADPVASTLVWTGDQRLASRLGASTPTEVDRVELTAAEGAGRWRRARFYEHCVLPHDVDAFAERLRARDLARCTHCGDAVTRHCSFCLSQEGAHA